jgi:predicted Zn finger-like uncharacterized protein
MPVEISCQNCHSKLRISENAVGKQVRCPTCAAVFVASAAGAAPMLAPVPTRAAPPGVNPYSPGKVRPQNPLAGSGAPPGNAQLTPGVIGALARTRPWVLFHSILGMIATAIYLLSGFVQVIVGLFSGRAAIIGMGFVWLLLSALPFFPSYFLLRYSRAIGRFTGACDAQSLEAALTAQRSFWRLVGIMAIVGIGLALLLLAFEVAATLLTAIRGT